MPSDCSHAWDPIHESGPPVIKNVEVVNKTKENNLKGKIDKLQKEIVELKVDNKDLRILLSDNIITQKYLEKLFPEKLQVDDGPEELPETSNTARPSPPKWMVSWLKNGDENA